MEEIQDLFKKISSKLLYIIPNTFRLKPDHPIPASKLTLEFINHWPPNATVKAEFMAIKLDAPGMGSSLLLGNI